MLRYKARISGEERRLIETIQKVGYGEIYAPKMEGQQHNEETEVSANIRDLLELIRSGAPVSIIIIHQNEPVYAEVDQVVDGFRCRMKVRFPCM